MNLRFTRPVWIAGVGGMALVAVQTALAGSDALTLRFATAFAVTVGGALIASRNGRPASAAPLDPIALVLGGLAGLSVFPVAWWAMDLTDHLLRQGAGLLPLPDLLSRDADWLLGLDLRSASYELAVLSAVVLIPLAQSWLLWGLLRRELMSGLGAPRGVWAAGIVGGCVLALSAPQQVEPALPYGLASLPGYVLVGVVAAWAAALSGTFWAGFAVHGTFAYASLALRDDLLRALGGKDYLDPAWLSVLVLGAFGTAVMLQMTRYRVERPIESATDEQPSRKISSRVLVSGVMVVMTAIVLVAIEVARRG